MKNTQGIPPLPRSTVYRRLRTSWYAFRHKQQVRRQEVHRRSPQARFDQLLAAAQQVAALNPRGLVDLVHAILRPLQSEYLLGVAELGQDPYPDVDSSSFFGAAARARLCTADGMRWRGKSLNAADFRLNLALHAVLPLAWSASRYVDALATIGSAKYDDGHAAWRQDDNHRVTLWLPWGIGFVGGGNHSITAGILAGEGSLQPTAVYDMSYLLDEIRSDGAYYLNVRDGKRICPVSDVRRAAVFEIGRLMRDTNYPAFREPLICP